MMMMNEKESEIEREEEESVDHFIHHHPLTLVQSNDQGHRRCHGCRRFFWGEAAYACKTCNNKKIMHEECAKMPREIMHPLHPQHTLIQKKDNASSQRATCALCERQIFSIGYFCSSTCGFQLHLKCTPAIGVKHVSDEQIKSIDHWSHPEHQLILSRKILSFKCDACGAMETGRSYVCSACQYCIHERCANLPSTAEFQHHNHCLTLAFCLPHEYAKYLDMCGVCDKDMFLNGWVYHCKSCRYVVHIKCAFTISSSSAPVASSSDTAIATGVDGVVQFPLNNVHEELIKSFVIKERGEQVLTIPYDNQKFMFPVHNHQLTVVSSSISEFHDDDDDDDSYSGSGDGDCEERISELVCDACTLPIFPKMKQYQSCASTSKYLSCDECKYFLHWECFHLPREFSNHPLHPKHHKLILEGCGKLDFHKRCTNCKLWLNGLFYRCTECDFKADVKCASLPNTMKHAAHPKHYLDLKFVTTEDYSDDFDEFTIQYLCSGCRGFEENHMLYKCRNCKFNLCVSCVFFPATNTHESDKHPLPLRYDAKLDRLGDFLCDECEREMDHNAWMYRCKDCDTSFHPECFNTTSGFYQNIKFGQQYGVSADIHPHPLTFQLLTTKLYCDVCRDRVYGKIRKVGSKVYVLDQRGFHCFSCNFFMCLARCRNAIVRAID